MSGKEGLIREYLEKKVPTEWDNMGVSERKMFLNGNAPAKGELITRRKVFAAEVWVECFNGDPKHLKRPESMEINGILRGLQGWRPNRAARRYGPYGPQRGFERE